MKLLQLDPLQLRQQLAGPGVWLRTGPFSLMLQSRISAVAESLARLYGQFEVRSVHEAFADFHVSVNPPSNMRRWLYPQAEFSFDGMQPFHPLPLDQAFPMLEWGLNWCVQAHAYQYLMIHAAVVEKSGRAAIVAAPSGSGKSTLVAGLVLSGWRLFSDELALVERRTGWIYPLPRPICLKNESIPLIRFFSPDAYINPASRNTAKGTIAFLRPPKESVRRQHEPAQPGWVIFPNWLPDAEAELKPRSKPHTFKYLVQHTVNNAQHGANAIRICSDLIRQTNCYDFQYGRLEDAVAVFDRLAAPLATDEVRS